VTVFVVFNPPGAPHAARGTNGGTIMDRNNVAIACQGGGSQTAFTAGVLKTFLEHEVHHKKNIVAFSGTSGGAICATLAWYALRKAVQDNETPSVRPLLDFWQDNSTQNLYEDCLNDFLVGSLRLMEGGLLPQWATSPDAPYLKTLWPLVYSVLPHRNFYDFQKLLATHIDFGTIAVWDRNSGPALLVGAADVLNGEFRKFSSRKGEIELQTLMASAAVPTLFPAVRIGNSAYWDGLFSDNPPTDELLDEDFVGSENLPDELWIIQINPKKCSQVPVLAGEIADRRNEMIGNESLYQDVEKIELINRFLAQGAFTPEYRARYRPVQLRFIVISENLQKRLDYATKLDRSRKFIDDLMRDGEIQARRFLRELGL
jgi:NTE family protein